MANRAYLIGHPSAARKDIPQLLRTLKPDKHTLVAANYLVPVFWFTLFERAHLVNLAYGEDKIPIFVSSASVSRGLMKKRREMLLARFTGSEEYWEAWEKLIQKVDCQTFILEMSEIWELDPKRNTSNAAASVRWFKSQSTVDFKSFLELAGLKYNSQTRSYRVPAGGSLSNSLRGSPWVRKIPWKSDDVPPLVAAKKQATPVERLNDEWFEILKRIVDKPIERVIKVLGRPAHLSGPSRLDWKGEIVEVRRTAEFANPSTLIGCVRVHECADGIFRYAVDPKKGVLGPQPTPG